MFYFLDMLTVNAGGAWVFRLDTPETISERIATSNVEILRNARIAFDQSDTVISTR